MAAGLAVALVVGGIAMERSLGVRGPALARVPIPAASSGAWFCPHGGGEGWETWVVIANPSDHPTQLSLFTAGGAPGMKSGVLEPGTHRYVPVEAESLSAGTVVEFFGGDAVAAGWPPSPARTGPPIAGTSPTAPPTSRGKGRAWWS
jgi:hypothetical protein